MSKAKKVVPEPFRSLFELINNDRALCKRTDDFPISRDEITMPNGSIWVFTYGNCSCDISFSAKGVPAAFKLIGRYDVLIKLNDIINRQYKRRKVGAYDPKTIATTEERRRCAEEAQRKAQIERQRTLDVCVAQLQKDADESRAKKRRR